MATGCGCEDLRVADFGDYLGEGPRGERVVVSVCNLAVEIKWILVAWLWTHDGRVAVKDAAPWASSDIEGLSHRSCSLLGANAL